MPDDLVARALDGDRRAVAKLITLLESGGDGAHEAVARLYAHTGNAYTVGMTGSPGAGKSTLADRLVTLIRDRGEEVGVLAVDPSSPFTGGAILGDRVRMQAHATDTGVFIRSMATRGHLGGLALATPQAVRVLDAAGKPWVIIETVGVGQVEVEVAGAADTTVVVVNPGWGDAVQANKAGLLEIADIFVINKADREGAPDTRRDLDMMLEMSDLTDWRPPIVDTVATTGQGVDELWQAIADHRGHIERSGALERRREERVRHELHDIVLQRLHERASLICSGEAFDAAADAVLSRELDPYAAADKLMGA